MKHYLTSSSIFTSYVCIDTDKKTIIHAYDGNIHFSKDIDLEHELEFYLAHDYIQCEQQEFDEYYKQQVEILNSIVSC